MYIDIYRQRGSVLLYGAIAAGLVIAGLTIALKVQSERLDGCQAKTEGLTAQLQAQNDAVQRLADESARKTADAAKKLAGARQATASAVTEAQRLRGLATQPRPPTQGVACLAGEAVKNVRSGLK